MPRGDRTGPDGRGPRGGVCVDAGQRRFFGFGRGRGAGRRGGMGFARGFGGIFPANQVSEKQALENRKIELEQELAFLKSRLNENSETSEN